MSLTCTSCKKDKDNSEFRKNINFKSRGGYSYQCKKCDKGHKQTSHGRLVIMFNSAKTASKNRGMDAPTFTFEELKQFANGGSYNKLYKAWEASGFDTELTPSIDRMDTNTSYTIKNIRFVTWKKNKDLNMLEISKPVLRIDDKGHTKQFASLRQASAGLTKSGTASGVLKAIHSGNKYMNYLWQYKK